MLLFACVTVFPEARLLKLRQTNKLYMNYLIDVFLLAFTTQLTINREKPLSCVMVRLSLRCSMR